MVPIRAALHGACLVWAIMPYTRSSLDSERVETLFVGAGHFDEVHTRTPWVTGDRGRWLCGGGGDLEVGKDG